jgi:hypothetical protein
MIELATLVLYPVHSTYPLIVTASTLAVFVSGKLGSRAKVRTSIFAICAILSAVVAVSAMASTDPVLTDFVKPEQALVLLGSGVIFCVLAMFVVKRVFWLKNFIAALLTTVSVFALKVCVHLFTADGVTWVSVGAVASAVAIVLSARRTISMHILFSSELASWTVCLVTLVMCPVWTVKTATSEQITPLLISLVNGYLLRHTWVMAPDSFKKSDDETTEPAATTVTRRKHLTGSSGIELRSVNETPPEDDYGVVKVDTAEFEVAVPSSTASTASSSRNESVVIVAQPTLAAAEIDSDEDEVFRRISQFNV